MSRNDESFEALFGEEPGLGIGAERRAAHSAAHWAAGSAVGGPGIPPGLSRIHRQEARFPELRDRLLAAASAEPALAGWRPRAEDDLGVMLLEMWAYVADSLSFYDETLAHEAYLRTARRRPSLARLVELLGYRPRPAVGASVYLGALAAGEGPVKLPAGTAFRSGAFRFGAFDDGAGGSEAPQIFELQRPAEADPRAGRFLSPRTRPATVGELHGDPPASIDASGGGAGGTIYSLDKLLLPEAAARVLKAGEIAFLETPAFRAIPLGGVFEGETDSSEPPKDAASPLPSPGAGMGVVSPGASGSGGSTGGSKGGSIGVSTGGGSRYAVGGGKAAPTARKSPKSPTLWDGTGATLLMGGGFGMLAGKGGATAVALGSGSASLATDSFAASGPPPAFALRISALDTVTGTDGESYARAGLGVPVQLPGSLPLRDARVLRPTRTAGLWQRGGDSGIGRDRYGNTPAVILDGLHPSVRPGDPLLLTSEDPSVPGGLRWFRVKAVLEAEMTVAPGTTTQISHPDGNSSVTSPPVKAPATLLLLDADLNHPSRRGGGEEWSADDAGRVRAHFLFREAGTLTAELRSAVPSGTPFLPLAGGKPGGTGVGGPAFLLSDAGRRGARVEGAVESDPSVEGGCRLSVEGGLPEVPGGAFAAPIDIFGNVLLATRGESTSEVLGSGDAGRPSQSFRLSKGPLTYLPSEAAGNDGGVVSTLEVRVDGVLWREVPSFFGVGADEAVYVVRQHEAPGGGKGSGEEESVVTFGDGIRGRRLPSGEGNVTASYRFGAGAASPPAGSITQLVRPLPSSAGGGVTGVVQPMAAFGGADREGAESLRSTAPTSALLLGRAVSLADFKAAAARVPGVEAVEVGWRWQARGRRPMVEVRYVGAAELAASVRSTLRNLAEPGTLLAVEPAVGVPLTLGLDLEIDPAHLPAAVRAAVREVLLGEEGLLAAARVGIGRPLVRSRLVAAILSVPGVRAVRDLTADGTVVAGMALSPGPGRYFDVAAGGLVIDGQPE